VKGNETVIIPGPAPCATWDSARDSASATGCYGYPMEHSMEKITENNGDIWRSMEQFAADST